MAAGNMSKANSRKSNNKKRQSRKLGSWAQGQKRKDLNRQKHDPAPGTKQPPGPEQNRVPFILIGTRSGMLTPLPRGDNQPVYERLKEKKQYAA